MKIAVSFFAISLTVPFLIPDSDAAEVVTRHDLLITRACQMGRDDAKAGKVMDSMGISLKNAGSKYIELEKIIRKEYRRCYAENNTTITNAATTSDD